MWSALASSLLFAVIAGPTDPVVIHVAAADGEQALRTALARAEQLVRDGTDVEVRLATGRHHFRNAFVLRARGPGSLRILPADGAEVVLDGSISIDPTAFAPVTDDGERARLPASAAANVLVQTIEDSELAAQLARKLVMPLLVDGRPYLPARFPNEGFAHLSPEAVAPEVSPPAVPVGKQNYGVRAGHKPWQEADRRAGWLGSLAEPRGAWVRIGERADERAGTWQQWRDELLRSNRRNMLTGFLDANWLQKSQPIVAADPERRSFRLSQALAYGWAWRKDKPFFVTGLLCELDAPGEWHYDPTTRRLFFYPPAPLDESSRLNLPVAAGGLRLDACHNVSIESIAFEHIGSGTVIDVARGRGVRLLGLQLRSSSATGVRLSGNEHCLRDSDLVDLDAHVQLAGGTRGPGTLEAGNNLVENCHLWQRTFRHRRVGVGIRGVGNTFRNNLVHNSLGQSITVRGNDHLIERNEIFNVGYEEGDGGAIYAGGDLTGYGTTYRHNFVHHLMHVPGKVERSGIHLDDLQAGATCEGNIFYKSAAKGVFMNGGAGHTIVDNVFVAGYRGAYNVGAWSAKNHRRQAAIDADPQHDYHGKKEDYIGNAERIVGENGWLHEPWATRYPRFAQVMADAGEFGRFWPIRCVTRGNVYCQNTKANRTVWSRVAPEALAKCVLGPDVTVTADIFADVDVLDLSFRSTRGDLPDIPFERIGLYVSRHRPTRPDPASYRRAVREFFAGVPSMPGTRRVLDSAKVVEASPRLRR